MQLNAFEASHSAAVAGWVLSAEECRRWCNREEVSAEAVVGWAAESDVTAYVAVESGRPVAYGELWIDDEEHEVELARLIVAPANRGRGVGRELVARLTDEALRRYPAGFMRVHPDNEPALRCYAAAGYVRVPREQAEDWNSGQTVPYVWLRNGDR
ncbi:GNAT family N-acetyltransferase [Micromonospora chersina]|uniref:GNAT family N-acetyltransferase n=1 Tax=Micromonospora chersina TaxID=47854 RepID=UPI003714E091